MEGEGVKTLLYSTAYYLQSEACEWSFPEAGCIFALNEKKTLFSSPRHLLLVTFNLEMSGCNLYLRGSCPDLKKGLLVAFRVFKWRLCYFSKFLDFTAKEADGENITWKALSSSTDSEMLNPEGICICLLSLLPNLSSCLLIPAVRALNRRSVNVRLLCGRESMEGGSG